MLINNLKICNFGSYEGATEFNLTINESQKNVILIGGKNGSGKTTLFSAIKIGLYGPIAFGYETASPSYYRNIRNYINNRSLTNKNGNTYISIDFSLEEERDLGHYKILRKWSFEDKRLIETCSVYRNKIELSEEDIISFESYLQFIIPPQLFDLFFFDGEKISDFFLNGNSPKNFKDALLILSGFDTFDVIKNNFKRFIQKGDSELLTEEEEKFANLSETKDNNETMLKEQQKILDRLQVTIQKLEESRVEVEKQFRDAGGLLAEEINKIKADILQEEKYREEKNEWLKDFANDYLPFLITHDFVNKVKDQVAKETRFQKYKAIKDSLNEDFLKTVINEEVENKKLKITDESNHDQTAPFVIALANHIDRQFRPDFDIHNFKPLHYLSPDEESEISALIKQIESQKISDIKKCKDQINKSLIRAQELRKQFENSQNNDHLTNFLERFNNINAEIQQLIIEKERTENHINELEVTNENLTIEIKKASELLTKLRKDSSILSLCTKGLNLFDNFVPLLIQQELAGIKDRFIYMFNQLISKQNYVETIDIDSDFNITLYRDTLITTGSLENMMAKIGINGMMTHLGDRSIIKLKELLHVSKEEEIEKALKEYPERLIPLPTKVDINSFSKGEQQIYIMSLYWALVKVSKYEIPFIIDTPYARIDSMHRENITTKFFPNLSSQVIILSTDEEVNLQYYRALNPFIAKEYTISYSDNEQKTNVEEKYFFEVAS